MTEEPMPSPRGSPPPKYTEEPLPRPSPIGTLPPKYPEEAEPALEEPEPEEVEPELDAKKRMPPKSKLPIKVLYVIEWSVIGGAGVVLKRLFENIDRSIYKTDVCVMDRIGGLHKAFSSKGKVFSLKDEKDKYAALKKIIIKGNYSVVQLYTLMDFLKLAEEIKNTKFVCQLNFPLWESRKFKRPGGWLQSIQKLKRHLHAVVSDSSQQLAIKDIQLIRNGVDTSKFKPRKKDPKLVVWIGRMLRAKGPTVILDIAREMPDYKFLMIIGFEWKYPNGWKPYQTWLDDALKNRPSNVEVKYGLSEDEVAKTLSKASFYILPSISESSPITVIEAMASGCVVLSTKVGDVPNMIKHGHDGFIIPHRDLIEWNAIEERLQPHISPKSKKLDEQIKRYVVDMIPKIDIAEIGGKARESVKNLTIENQAKQYEFLYGRMGGHKGQTRIAFVWGYPDIAKAFWESKVDSMQHAIKKLSEENCVILFAPRPKEEHRERAIINGCNVVFYPHDDEKTLMPLMKDFNPNVICLNSVHSKVHESIVKTFPSTYKTIYEYGGELDNPILKEVDVLFVQQKFRSDEAVKMGGLPMSKVVVNPHCVNTDLFKPIKIEKKYNAVMVADFRRQIKRQDILIRAWKDVPGKLLLVARLNQPAQYGQYELYCRQIIQMLGIENRVFIQDFVPNEQLPAILNQCKIGIMTSKREGGSRAMLEVMSCGLPMIVLDDSKGCIEMIRPGIDGLVSSPDKLGDTINNLLKNPKKLEQMSEAATTRIQEEYPYNRMLNVFKEVISEVRPEISIITTSMNRGEYLEDCIKSVLAQDHRKFKINHIIMDGGSKDGSLAILRKYENRINYVYGGDKGQRDAVDKAFDIINEKHPNTSYVGWINADDFYMPQWLSESYGVLSRLPPNVAMTCSDYNAVDMFKGGKVEGRSSLDAEWIEAASLLTGNRVCQPTVLMRKTALDKLKNKYGWYLNPEIEFIIDYEFWCRFIEEGYKIKNIRKPLANHRLHSKQMGRNNPVPMKEESIKVQNKLKRSTR